MICIDGKMYVRDGLTSRELNEATASPTDPVSMTQQQFASELDINTILRRFNVTGSAPLGAYAPMYGDFTGIHDWQDAVEKVRRANEDFMRLPPEVRERFRNDPGELIEYAKSHTFEQWSEEAEALQAKRDALQARADEARKSVEPAVENPPV